MYIVINLKIQVVKNWIIKYHFKIPTTIEFSDANVQNVIKGKGRRV